MNITYEFLPGWRKIECLLTYCSADFKFLPKVILCELENSLITPATDSDIFRTHGRAYNIKILSDSLIKAITKPDISIVILSNQIKASPMHQIAIKIKLEQFIKKTGLPVLAFFALKPNRYAKPHTGMWKLLHSYYRTRGHAAIEAALLVSNNGGRVITVRDKVKCDTHDFDRAFAHNCELKYMSVNEFLNKTTERFEWSRKYISPETRQLYIDKINSMPPLDIVSKLNPELLNIVCVYGAPRSGKTTYINSVIEQFNEKHADLNMLAVIDRETTAFKRAESILKDENNVIVESHCTTATQRAKWTELAKKYTALVFFVEVDPTTSMAHIFNCATVERSNSENVMLYPDSAYFTYKSDLEHPENPLIYYPRIIADDVILKYRF